MIKMATDAYNNEMIRKIADGIAGIMANYCNLWRNITMDYHQINKLEIVTTPLILQLTM